MGCFGKAHLERHIIVLQPCFHRIMLYMVRRVDFLHFILLCGIKPLLAQTCLPVFDICLA